MKAQTIKYLWVALAVAMILENRYVVGQDELRHDYFVYVTCESADEVDVVRFDGVRAVVVHRIPVGFRSTEIEGPHGITLSPDGKYWFLTMAHGIPFGQVYKFSTDNNRRLGQGELGLFPATMQISVATGLLHVVNFNLHGDREPSSVSIVDPVEMAEVARIQTGVMPHGSRFSPDGRHHYSAAMMSDTLYEIDALDFEVKRTLKISPKHHHTAHDKLPKGHHKHMAMPTWVQIHPALPRAYVALNGSDEVVEVDLEEWKVRRRFATSERPYNVEITPEGTRMVVTYKKSGSTGVWDLATGTELVRISHSRQVPHGIAITPDSRYAFVTVEGKGSQPGAVELLDLVHLKRITLVDVAQQASGIAFWKMQLTDR